MGWARLREGLRAAQVPHPPSACIQGVTNPDASNPSFWVQGASLHRQDSFSHGPLVAGLGLQPLLPPELKVLTLQSLGWFPGNQPSSLEALLKSSYFQNKRQLYSLSLRDLQELEELRARNWRPNTYFSL